MNIYELKDALEKGDKSYLVRNMGFSAGYVSQILEKPEKHESHPIVKAALALIESRNQWKQYVTEILSQHKQSVRT